MKNIFVKTIAKALFPFGEYQGLPCLYIAQGKKDVDTPIEIGDFYNLVLSYSKVLYLWFDAEISETNPDFFEVIVGLAKRGRHKLILRTPMSSDITSLKSLRNIAIIWRQRENKENQCRQFKH